MLFSQHSSAMFYRAIPVAMTTHLCALYIRWRGWGRDGMFYRAIPVAMTHTPLCAVHKVEGVGKGRDVC